MAKVKELRVWDEDGEIYIHRDDLVELLWFLVAKELTQEGKTSGIMEDLASKLKESPIFDEF